MHISGRRWRSPQIVSCDLNALLREVLKRHSSNPIDKMCAIAFPFMKCNYAFNRGMTLPIYGSNTPTSVAWKKVISSLASTTMRLDELALEPYLDDNDSEDGQLEYDQSEDDQSKSLSLPYTATAQLLCLFPHPSQHHWFPSWTQVQQYPDVPVRDGDPRDSDPRDSDPRDSDPRDSDPIDSDPSQTTSGMDFSLRIMSGRIYRGCSLQLIKPPTPETKAIYCSTVDGKDAQLVATVPGIELHIDSRSKYVLVDISPDLSLWPDNDFNTCKNTDEGHEHLPIWPKSVIIVCEEVDTLALECPSAVTKYHLRRVTTLEWECRQPGKPDPGYWLPFEPSLEHMRSIVCSAKGREFLQSVESIYEVRSDNEDIDLDVFCDPVAVASLLSQEGWHKDWPQGWHSQWPTCKVYVM